MALVDSDRGETLRPAGLGARRGSASTCPVRSPASRCCKGSLARNDSLGAADIESRIARIRRG